MATEVFAFDCVPSFSSGESSADGQGFSHRSRATRRRETLTGSLPACIVRGKTKAPRPQLCRLAETRHVQQLGKYYWLMLSQTGPTMQHWWQLFSVFQRRQGLQHFTCFRATEKRVVLADLSVPKDQHALGELRDVVLVSDQNDRQPFLVQVLKDLHDFH